MLNSRELYNRREWRAIDAVPLESWIQRDDPPSRENQGQFAGWWLEGLCKLHLADVLSGEYQWAMRT